MYIAAKTHLILKTHLIPFLFPSNTDKSVGGGKYPSVVCTQLEHQATTDVTVYVTRDKRGTKSRVTLRATAS